jgi:hypothetical protein
MICALPSITLLSSVKNVELPYAALEPFVFRGLCGNDLAYGHREAVARNAMLVPCGQDRLRV